MALARRNQRQRLLAPLFDVDGYQQRYAPMLERDRRAAPPEASSTRRPGGAVRRGRGMR